MKRKQVSLAETKDSTRNVRNVKPKPDSDNYSLVLAKRHLPKSLSRLVLSFVDGEFQELGAIALVCKSYRQIVIDYYTSLQKLTVYVPWTIGDDDEAEKRGFFCVGANLALQYCTQLHEIRQVSTVTFEADELMLSLPEPDDDQHACARLFVNLINANTASLRRYVCPLQHVNIFALTTKQCLQALLKCPNLERLQPCTTKDKHTRGFLKNAVKKYKQMSEVVVMDFYPADGNEDFETTGLADLILGTGEEE
jgi:hypothetical protein